MAKAENLVELMQLVKEAKPRIDELKADLLHIMQSGEVLGLKTKTYTISVGHRVSPHIADFETLRKSLDTQEIPTIVNTQYSLRELSPENKELK